MPRPEGPRHSLRSGSRSDSLRGSVAPAVLKCTIVPGICPKGTPARRGFSSALLSLSPSLPLPGPSRSGHWQWGHLGWNGPNTGPWWLKVASQLMHCIIHHILPSPVPYVLLGRTRAHGFRLAMLHLPHVSKARAHVQQPCSCRTRGTADRLFSAYDRLCCRACTHSGILGSCCV